MTAQHYSRRASRNWTPKKRCSTYIRCMLSERMRKRLATDRTSFIEPCLPSPAAKPPSGSNWIHEIKHDGFRLIARRDPPGGHPAHHPQGQRLDHPLPARGRDREPHVALQLPSNRDKPMASSFGPFELGEHFFC
jgi:hypothetical protein